MYSRQIPIMHTLNRLMLNFKTRKSDKGLSIETFQHLVALQFPKMTILKFINSIIFPEFNQSRSSFSSKDVLKFVIIILEEKHIPLEITAVALGQIPLLSLTKLEDLSILYHIMTIVPKCLEMKVEYQANRRHLKEVLFNPYSAISEE